MSDLHDANPNGGIKVDYKLGYNSGHLTIKLPSTSQTQENILILMSVHDVFVKQGTKFEAL